MDRIKPLKRFGQNYLKDTNILKKIAEEINPAKDDNILEIGPGNGALTKFLVEKCNNVMAVEIDKRVIENLKNQFPSIHLINTDFMDLDLADMPQRTERKLKVVGNIPYNITSPILFRLFEYNTRIAEAVLMVQLEVAQRMTAKTGTKDYGILSVLLNYFGKAKIAFKVSPQVFYPKPKVQSAVVHIHFDDVLTDADFNRIFIRVVKAAFGNRRKTLKNSLSNSIFAEINFEDCGINLSHRAEQLTVNDFIVITKFVISKRHILQD